MMTVLPTRGVLLRMFHTFGVEVLPKLSLFSRSQCDDDLIPVLLQPLYGNDLQTENTF